MPKTEMPKLPNTFPGHSPNSAPRMTGDYVLPGLKVIKLWIFGGACPKTIADKIQQWRSELMEELASRQVAVHLTKPSHERLALGYCFHVLLLDSIKDAILEDGPEEAAASLCVGAFLLLHFGWPADYSGDLATEHDLAGLL